MPSPEMRAVLAELGTRQKVAASGPSQTLKQLRAGFVPTDRVHPIPADVRVTDVVAGGVPAHWLDAPGAAPGRVLLFLHGGGYQFRSLRSDGELAARIGRAAGCAYCSRSIDSLPSIHTPRRSTT